MACEDYVWCNVEHKTIQDVIKWFQNKFDLRDWAITIETSTNPPDRFTNDELGEKICARCEMVLRYHVALIWIPLNRLKSFNINAIQTTIHEMLHIFCDARRVETDDESDDDPIECLITGLEHSICKLYYFENKLKEPKVRPEKWKKS